MRVAHPLPRPRRSPPRSITTRSSTPCRGCAAREPRGGACRSATASGSPSYRRFNRWSGDGAMEHLLMDRAHEGDPTRPPAESFGLTLVVPPRRNRTAPWDCDREAYKGRNMVERVFNRMKSATARPPPATTGSTRPSSPTSGSSSSTHLPEKHSQEPN